MAVFCARCGANLALVGRAHRCVPRAHAQPADDDAANAPPASVTYGANVTHGARSKAAARQAKYRAKDPELYRKRHRELMRKRRAERRAS